MAYYKTARLKKTIRKFVALLKEEISVDRVVLFGSYAWGRPKPYSDIDLAIFSRDFKDKDEIKNMQYLFKRACQIDPVIEPHPFHPKDLKKLDKRTLLYQIMKKGREVPV